MNEENFPNGEKKQDQISEVKRTDLKNFMAARGIALLIFCLVVVSMVTYAVILKNQSKKSSDQQQAQNQTKKNVQQTGSSLPCQSGWDQYKNDVLGMAFCYPAKWGEPDLEYLHYLTRVSSMKEDFARLNIYYDNSLKIKFSDNDKVNIVLFNDEFSGKSERNIVEPAEYYATGATDRVIGLKKNGNICDYEVDFSYRYSEEMQPETVKTLYSDCKNQVKTVLTWQPQHFDFNNVGDVYTYDLKLLAFNRISNGYFDNVLISQDVDYHSQVKEKISTLDEFFNKALTTEVKDETARSSQAQLAVEQEEFAKFAKSFSAFKPAVPLKEEFQSVSEENPLITTIRKYYWLITNGKLEEAYAMYGNSQEDLEIFKAQYANVFQARPRDFVSQGGSSYEFHVDYQDHNDVPKDYRVKMTVENGKITSSVSEEIVDQPVSNGKYSAYVKSSGGMNYVILVDGGQESIIDQGQAEYDDKYSNVNEVKFFRIKEFSPSGKYLVYQMSGWEWGFTFLYDLASKKKVLEIEGPQNYGFTKDESALYYCMDPGMTGGNGAVYSIPGFSKEYDIYSDSSNGEYMSVSCGYNEVDGYVSFVLGNKGVDQDGGSKEVRYYLDSKKTETFLKQ